MKKNLIYIWFSQIFYIYLHCKVKGNNLPTIVLTMFPIYLDMSKYTVELKVTDYYKVEVEGEEFKKVKEDSKYWGEPIDQEIEIIDVYKEDED